MRTEGVCSPWAEQAPRLTTAATQISLIALGFPGCPCAQVVKLVDTLASGASARKGVEVQVLFWAPFCSPNQAIPIVLTLLK